MPTKTTALPVKSRIDLPVDSRTAVVDQLNLHLADLSDLYTQTKYAHWNVKGRTFWALHKMFDELAEKIEDAVDEVAERATALGGLARGTTRMAAGNTRLDEFPRDAIQSDAVLEAMADRYAACAESIRRGIDEANENHDASTADLLTGISRMLDQSLYFIESHLQK